MKFIFNPKKYVLDNSLKTRIFVKIKEVKIINLKLILCLNVPFI